MEDWERNLREKLEKELPNRIYRVGDILMGKAAYIDIEIALKRKSRPFYNGALTYEMLDEFIKDLIENKSNDSNSIK